MDVLKEVMYAGGICRKIGNEVAGVMDYRVLSLYLCLPNWVMWLCLVPVGTLIPLIFCNLDSGKTRSFNLRKELKGKPDEAGLKLSENRCVHGGGGHTSDVGTGFPGKAALTCLSTCYHCDSEVTTRRAAKRLQHFFSF